MLRVTAIALVAAIAVASPKNLICEDPRLTDGGKIMGMHVTFNPYATEIRLESDATQYEYGTPVRFTVKANGTKFTSETVLFGVQVEFNAGNGEAMGQFHDLSDDLELTKGCSSSLYTKSDTGAF